MKIFLKAMIVLLILADLLFIKAACNSYSTKEQVVNIPIPQKIEKIQPPPANETEEQLLERQIVRTTIKISSERGTGTGVIIYQNNKIAYIITALHVVAEAIKINGLYIDDTHYIMEPLKLEYFEFDSDLAFLSSRPSWYGCANFLEDAKEVQRFSKAYTFGFIGSVPYTGILSSGNLSELTNKDFRGERMTTSIPAIFGNSGGGIFVKINGNYKIISVVSSIFYITHGEDTIWVCHVSMGSTPEQFVNFIKKARENNK